MTKPTKWHVRPAKTQISLGIRPVWSESLLSAWRKLGSFRLSYPLSAQQRLRTDWADAQADLGLRWVHSHFVGFVMRWLILNGTDIPVYSCKQRRLWKDTVFCVYTSYQDFFGLNSLLFYDFQSIFREYVSSNHKKKKVMNIATSLFHCIYICWILP